jgi:hypothetical protein
VDLGELGRSKENGGDALVRLSTPNSARYLHDAWVPDLQSSEKLLLGRKNE